MSFHILQKLHVQNFWLTIVTSSTCTVELPGHFCVWLASPEAKFLKDKFVWANWDVDELKERADEIKNNKFLLTVHLDGVDM